MALFLVTLSVASTIAADYNSCYCKCLKECLRIPDTDKQECGEGCKAGCSAVGHDNDLDASFELYLLKEDQQLY